MNRAIFSIFMGDICDHQSTPDKHFKPGAAKIYTELFDKIIYNHQAYANHIGAQYMLASADAEWTEFYRQIHKKYPNITNYNIINYYKFYMAEKLTKTYDEVLYVDFDAFFYTNDNFFDYHWCQKFNVLYHPLPVAPSKEAAWSTDVGIPKLRLRKAYFIQLALERLGIDPMEADMGMANTGVMGYNKSSVGILNYWDTFKELMPLMYPENDDCAVDNEVFFCAAAIRNNLEINCLEDDWNYKAKKPPFKGKICHFTNKEHMKDFFEEDNFRPSRTEYN